MVYDFSDPYWLVRYLEGDWEELNSSRSQTRAGVGDIFSLDRCVQLSAVESEKETKRQEL